MSDINKIVAAIISTARAYPQTGAVAVEVRVQDYQKCLQALNALEDQGQPAGPDLNEIKTAIIETLDRIIARK